MSIFKIFDTLAITTPTVHVNFYLLPKYLEFLISIPYIHFLKKIAILSHKIVSQYVDSTHFSLKRYKLTWKLSSFPGQQLQIP